jgi:fumarate hydratase class I
LAREESPAARDAIGQILANSRMAALGRRPICQDTGTAQIFVKLGIGARIESERSLQEIADDAVRQAWRVERNPLRASVVADPLFGRTNTGDNTPAMLHVEVVAGDRVEIHVAAKGGGSENKARFATLNPSDSVRDWVVRTVEGLGAGWCPPGLVGLGVGGSPEKAMTLAKLSLLDPDRPAGDPRARSVLTARGASAGALRRDQRARDRSAGPWRPDDGARREDRTFPVHAASLPLALIPQCAADRHVHFVLDGSGPAELTPPPVDLWPEDFGGVAASGRRCRPRQLTRDEVATWRAGETLLLSGRLLTGRDAAHLRLTRMLAAGEPLPVDLRDRAIYYVGPVDAVGDEAVGPAGPTTSTRMDKFVEPLLDQAGLLVMIGKAERGPAAIEAIARHGCAYLVAVGGAAYLVSKAIRSSRVLAFPELGMEAIHEFVVADMPVTVAVDATGQSIHRTGPARWRRPAPPLVPA